MHKSFITLAFLLLTGCAASSLNELQEKGHQKIDEIPVNYQAAYRNLRQQLEKCRGLDEKILKRSRIDHQLYTDIQEAHFTFIQTSAFGSGSPTMDIRLKPINSEKTEMITTTHYQAAMNAWHSDFVSWASGNFTPCR